MPDHHHRSGPLRQSNKRNKRNKSSKRSLTRLAGGKVDGRQSAYKQRLVAHTKADRRHIQQQRRDAKRQEVIRRKRGIDGGVAPPRVVGIISLGETEQTEEKLRRLVLGQADSIFQPTKHQTTITANFGNLKKDGNLTLLTSTTAFRSQYITENPSDAAVFAALDLARVCDILMFVIDAQSERPESIAGMSIGGDDRSNSTSKNKTISQDWDHLISERGDRVLSALKSQGLPRVVTILAKTEADNETADMEDDDQMTTHSAKSLRRVTMRRKADVKKYVCRFATTEFGLDNDKVFEVNLQEDHSKNEEGQTDPQADRSISPEAHSKRILAESLVRALCSMSASPPNWVSNLPRPYMLSDKYEYNQECQELRITGYMRGAAPFDVNSLMHVPNLGTFACKSVERAQNPASRDRKKFGTNMEDDDVGLIESNSTKRDSLDFFATPDALDGEQNLVGFGAADKELDDIDYAHTREDAESVDAFARPTGWSEYQSAWLDAVDDDALENDDIDHGELAKELNVKSSASVATDTMDLDDANEVTEEECRALIAQRKKQQREDLEFPDEMQVNQNEKARDRFARYRSLRSFKKSYWDPKENLPNSYACIFHFANFKSTQRSIMGDMRDLVKAAEACNGYFWNGVKRSWEDDVMTDESDAEEDLLDGCIPAGSYVTLTLEGVDLQNYSLLHAHSLLSVVALLQHENKVSVLQMGLSNCKSSDVPVKSKDILTFRCGWRTWSGRPVFSQNNLNCDKHKFERFMPPAGSFFAASVFGPVSFTPCPVLVFRESNGMKELVASGSIVGADADRIIVKRIVLTGYPVRVHKRFATVKYMFYDPEDVKWFKPAGLTTKHGLNGKIEESVGEHGTMKCLFNAPIKQHDTVCLCLYKRIYPKFVVEKRKSLEEEGSVRTTAAKNSLIVR